jgi:hypothetical protein
LHRETLITISIDDPLRRAGDGPTHSGDSSDSLLEELGAKAGSDSDSGSSSSSSGSEAERRRRKVQTRDVKG